MLSTHRAALLLAFCVIITHGRRCTLIQCVIDNDGMRYPSYRQGLECIRRLHAASKLHMCYAAFSIDQTTTTTTTTNYTEISSSLQIDNECQSFGNELCALALGDPCNGRTTATCTLGRFRSLHAMWLGGGGACVTGDTRCPTLDGNGRQSVEACQDSWQESTTRAHECS